MELQFTRMKHARLWEENEDFDELTLKFWPLSAFYQISSISYFNECAGSCYQVLTEIAAESSHHLSILILLRWDNHPQRKFVKFISAYAFE